MKLQCHRLVAKTQIVTFTKIMQVNLAFKNTQLARTVDPRIKSKYELKQSNKRKHL